MSEATPTPSVTTETKVGLKGLVGRKMSKEVTFIDTKVKITKLSVAQVLAIQEKAKSVEGKDQAGLDMIKAIISPSVEGGETLTDEDYSTFPMDELSKLSEEIMKFSGMGAEEGK